MLVLPKRKLINPHVLWKMWHEQVINYVLELLFIDKIVTSSLESPDQLAD